jgi:predicted transcriptional regulator YdeE
MCAGTPESVYNFELLAAKRKIPDKLWRMIFPPGLRVIALATLAATFTCNAASQNARKPELTEQAGFNVIGIEVRTNNAQQGSGGPISQQWQRLYKEGILDRIPGKLDQSVVVVCTNYASDWNGDYTYTLGAKVKPGAKPPAGMVAVSVPAGKYVEFISARGPGLQVIPEIWKQIWAYFDEPGSPARAYKTDFESHDVSDPNNLQAHIYIGVKP